MKKFALIFALATSPAFAQPPQSPMGLDFQGDDLSFLSHRTGNVKDCESEKVALYIAVRDKNLAFFNTKLAYDESRHASEIKRERETLDACQGSPRDKLEELERRIYILERKLP